VHKSYKTEVESKWINIRIRGKSADVGHPFGDNGHLYFGFEKANGKRTCCESTDNAIGGAINTFFGPRRE
jgi:hypothetical protein